MPPNAVHAGSSREFSGYEAAPSMSVITAILARASQFLPALGAVPPAQLLGSTRVGLRPFALGGLPAVGLVPGLPGVAVAAGHEGSGLTLGPATAELVLHQLLGRPLQEGEGAQGQQALSAAAAQLRPEARLAGVA